MRKLPWKKKYFLIVLTMLGVVGLQYCISLPTDSLVYTNSVWAFLLWAAVLYCLGKLTMGDRWEQIEFFLNPGFAFSLLFSGAMAAGRQLDLAGAVDFTDWRLFGGYWRWP